MTGRGRSIAEAGRRPSRHPFREREAGRIPLFVLLPASLALLLLALPIIGLAVRAPWREALVHLTDPRALEAIRLSLLTSVAALFLSTLLGVPLAWLFARRRLPAKRLLRALCLLPMVLPPVVAGVALLFAFGRRGLFGAVLDDAFGITLPFTPAAVILTQIFVAMPFLILTVEAGFRKVDARYEAVAATLGADRLTSLRRVTLPLLAPSLGAGMALCWMRALGEFGATITFAGNLPGATQTLPLAVYLELQNRPEVAILLSLLLLLFSGAVLATVHGRLIFRDVPGEAAG